MAYDLVWKSECNWHFMFFFKNHPKIESLEALRCTDSGKPASLTDGLANKSPLSNPRQGPNSFQSLEFSPANLATLLFLNPEFIRLQAFENVEVGGK